MKKGPEYEMRENPGAVEEDPASDGAAAHVDDADVREPVQRGNNRWYKNAVIYQLHVRSFRDSNGDGFGDFSGLIEKLDYLQWLGVSAVWILPFYPSPLRDDGYDVSDYQRVNELYGSMRDFRAFIRAAHARGIRVITELILNHTSDQHPWFQRARRAKPNSRARNYYVWSDTDTKFAGTRIIFTDTEVSNWAWDPVAQAYYWHRFFSHQPDLNFDSPDVVREMIAIMRFWFDIGVDGLRLDAAPYLCVREGTSNENLPETHAIIKKLRALVDEEYPDRVLLAEANQWPEDVQAYFGDADECQMAFHFPLMPRIFLSLATQDRFPVYDIMQQTPEIPESCQWAIFLRNHDEMTLEMVTDRERAFMYEIYAPELPARINVGIRRRLAPLLKNDRRKIELLMSLLLSMPGTPIIYYGDEIGMGDNIFLKDRDGVRTPMQWSPDRNAGFSSADAQQLCLPVIQDSLYGYEVTNVEAQRRNPSSLLNWLRRLISVRQSHTVFGEGRLIFLYPENRHIIAYIRESSTDAILCVANFAESAQSVQLDLSRYWGRTPVEMIGWSAFPRIIDQPYHLTLPANAFFWFLLRPDPMPTDALPQPRSRELRTLVLPGGWQKLGVPAALRQLEATIVPEYLSTQRWFTAVHHGEGIRVLDAIGLIANEDGPVCTILAIGKGETAACATLLWDHLFDFGATTGSSAVGEVARGRTGAREFMIYDASFDEKPWLKILQDCLVGREIIGYNGRLCFSTEHEELAELTFRSDASVRCLQADGAISGIIDDMVNVALYRWTAPGEHVEIETARALRSAGYTHVPALLGVIQYRAENGDTTDLGAIFRYVGNRGTGREIALGLVRQRLERGRLKPTPSTTGHRDDDGFGGILRYAMVIGQRIAQFHNALLSQGDNPAFATEVAGADYVEQELQRTGHAYFDDVSGPRQTEIQRQFKALSNSLLNQRIARVHGHLTLNEILVAHEDVMIVGAGGDPLLPPAARRIKRSPYVDLAQIAVSFDLVSEEIAAHISSDRTEEGTHLATLVGNLARRAREALYTGYEEGMASSIQRPVLEFFRVQALLNEYARNPLLHDRSNGSMERLLSVILGEDARGESA